MSEVEHGADERRLATGAALTLAALAVPAAGLAYWAAGWQGAVSALIGLAFVLVLFAGSAAMLSWAVARNPNGGVGVLIGGVMARLPLYTVALALLSNVSWVHGRSLALATVTAVAVTLAYEVRLISRSPRLFWVDPAAVRSATVSNATRSETL
jgi:hypothetical protein